ncbi:MAG: hypothetical protein WCM76_05400 [Bacteroidota bacterium]
MIKYKHTRFLIAIAILVGFSACKKNSSSTVYTPVCSGPAKSWQADVKPIMNTYCVGCHASFGGYTEMVASTTAIRSRVADGSMPQGNALSNDQKNIVLCWIDSGTPNN